MIECTERVAKSLKLTSRNTLGALNELVGGPAGPPDLAGHVRLDSPGGREGCGGSAGARGRRTQPRCANPLETALPGQRQWRLAQRGRPPTRPLENGLSAAESRAPGTRWMGAVCGDNATQQIPGSTWPEGPYDDTDPATMAMYPLERGVNSLIKPLPPDAI